MSFKSNIKKILFLSLAVVVGAGLLVLLIAAINKKNHKNCTGVDISISGKDGEFFLNRQDVMNVIMPDKNNPLRGKPLASFDLKKMETALEQNIWIKSGQLFFDNNGVLRVTVEERTPVARIFTVNGNSFYIDSSGKQLPLNSKLTVKLPVYSNFPADKERLYGADSLLMQQIKKMSPFILAQPFWMAQIGQIDITPNRTFEMIPVIGKHIIAFGDGSDYEQKFHRLFLFYQQVGARVGLDKYSIINVAYNKQVVATRKGTAGKIDSLQALKNIQKLIDASKQLLYDTVSTMVDNNIAVNAAPVPTLTILKDNQRNAAVKDSFNKVPSSTYPTSLKSRAAQPLKKAAPHPKENKQPKAVMKKAGG
jgi:cell division protein FtsQ